MKPRTEYFFPDPATTAYDEFSATVLSLMYLFVICMVYKPLMASLLEVIFTAIYLIRSRKRRK